tara:strand:+ start:178 stop:474 length:297 start_codon:yes stop_codon:yes gene_type:complete
MNSSWVKYQENRNLIDAFKRQTDAQNFGITFSMYRQARSQCEQYERTRYTQEGTGCPYYIDWTKPEGKSELWRDSIRNAHLYDDGFNDDWLDDVGGES